MCWRRHAAARVIATSSSGNNVSAVSALDRNHAAHARQYVGGAPCSTTLAAPIVAPTPGATTAAATTNTTSLAIVSSSRRRPRKRRSSTAATSGARDIRDVGPEHPRERPLRNAGDGVRHHARDEIPDPIAPARHEQRRRGGRIGSEQHRRPDLRVAQQRSHFVAGEGDREEQQEPGHERQEAGLVVRWRARAQGRTYLNLGHGLPIDPASTTPEKISPTNNSSARRFARRMVVTVECSYRAGLARGLAERGMGRPTSGA